MLNCREVTRLCSEAQERELTLGERVHLWWHTRMCVGCSNFRTQMAFLRRAAQNYRKGTNHDEAQ